MTTKKSGMNTMDQILEDGFAFYRNLSEASNLIQCLGEVRGVSYLEPKSQDDATSWSHSGVHGYGAFPWHTDGAISANPPHWMMLECLEDDAGTYTDLLEPDTDVLGLLRGVTLKMQDASGRSRDLPAASPQGAGRFKLRWDVRVGKPSDIRVAEVIEAAEPSTRMRWSPFAVLIVDNFRILHRRPSVQANVRRRLRRTYIGGSRVGL